MPFLAIGQDVIAPLGLCGLFLESGGFSKGACFIGLRAGAGTLSFYPARASAAASRALVWTCARDIVP